MKVTDTDQKDKTGPSDRNIRIAEIEFKHLDQGFLDTLDSLVTGTSNLTKSRAEEILQEVKANPLHRVFVAVMKEHGRKKVVGTITLLIEPKFIFSGRRIGHIEDVSVRKGYQNKKLGSKLVLHATKVARDVGCIKIVLDCSDETMPFYEKLGYSYQDNCMKRTFD